MATWLRTFLLLATVSPAAWAAAEDSYFVVPLGQLKLTEGSLPSGHAMDWRSRPRAAAMLPYAVLDSSGEAYVGLTASAFPWAAWSQPGGPPPRTAAATETVPPAADTDPQSLAIRAPAGKDVTGRLFFPKTDWSGMTMVKFVIPAEVAKAESRIAFLRAQRAHYERLLARNLPGAAWFRRQAHPGAPEAVPPDAQPPQATRPGPAAGTELSRTFDLFSGGRALSENLQLDRTLPPLRQTKDQTVALDSLTGITIREFDWTPLVKDLRPELDTLAAKIPADQHAIFFPTMQAATTITDQFRAQGTVFLQLAQPRSEDTEIIARYERQLGLSVDAAARLLGKLFVKSVAVTGSDPFFPQGTDVAVLLETAQPEQLATLILTRISLATAANPAAKKSEGTIGGLTYRGVTAPDRSVCSYVAQLEGAVVVTNSLIQLERLAGVQAGKVPALALLAEYQFFRDRYRRGAADETALAIVSDATIRRWCGPRWRIGDSRRVRHAAFLAQARAERLDGLVAGTAQPESPTGYGTLDFMTPLVELDLALVTQAEAQAYAQWRDGYQRNWNWAFDPIAIRLSVDDKRLAADVTVMPLIGNTEYRNVLSLTQGAALAAGAGDPHGAPVHVVLAINRQSELLRWPRMFLQGSLPGLKTDPLAWLGPSVAIYADDDPLWKQLAAVADKPRERDEFLKKEGPRLPLAANFEVTNGLSLTAFLAALRAFIEQTAPGMTQWESISYKDQAYVRITPTEQAKSQHREADRFAVYYHASGAGLVVTLNEELLKRAIDRQAARRAKAVAPPAAAAEWLGRNVALHVDATAVEVAAGFFRENYQQEMQVRAWANLPILNEWKRRYPGQDPVALHERYWQTRLVCPGGGKFVWNDAWQTYESTVYGHPGQPRSGPAVPPALGLFRSADFGLTFEHQGVRARAALERKNRKPND